MNDRIKTYLLDLAERALKTFFQAFFAVVIAGGFGIAGAVDISTVQKAAMAGLAAVLSLVMSIVSKWANSDTDTASLVGGIWNAAPATKPDDAA